MSIHFVENYIIMFDLDHNNV